MFFYFIGSSIAGALKNVAHKFYLVKRNEKKQVCMCNSVFIPDFATNITCLNSSFCGDVHNTGIERRSLTLTSREVSNIC